MFPGIDGFHWTAQHIIFLAVFLGVLVVIASTVAAAAARSFAGLTPQKADRIRWRSDFEDLPARDRKCRRQIAGEVSQRVCPNAFNCGECTEFMATHRDVAADVGDTFGLDYRPSRLYHRGHTWVETQPDGTMLVGLDDLARRVLGEAEAPETPALGTHLEANGIAWQIQTAQTSVRVLAPIAGRVVDVGGPGDEWVLRVEPDAPDAPQLLRGSEVRAWLCDELDRLQVLLTRGTPGVALADGGAIIDNLQQAVPDADWDNVVGSLMLQP
jgi:hypothetical protein